MIIATIPFSSTLWRLELSFPQGNPRLVSLCFVSFLKETPAVCTSSSYTYACTYCHDLVVAYDAELSCFHHVFTANAELTVFKSMSALQDKSYSNELRV